MKWRRNIFAGAIYAILIVGAIVFSFPFLWMVSTSLKMDRELFRGHLDLRPEQPNVRAQSPYYETRQFEDVEIADPPAAAIEPIIQRRVQEQLGSLPPAANMADLPQILHSGLFAFLRQRTPASLWGGSDTDALRRFAEGQITPQQVHETARDAYRELSIASIWARGEKTEESSLAADRPPAETFNNLSPQVATLAPSTENSFAYAAIKYDFSRGDHFELSNTFDLPFPAAELRRIRLRMRPDDTWHELQMTVEAAGQRYVAQRAISLADSRWITQTWQKPSIDDDSTKLRMWVVLRPVEHGPQFDHGPQKVKVSLEIRRLSSMQAAFAKARHNYIRVLEQIPFWRYVRVSILLVVLNIVLTVLSSSLVAYAFARLQWPGRDVIFLVMLGTMMIPGQVTMIPHFLIWSSVGAYNTLSPLYLGAMFGNAFYIFLMRQFLKGIPSDLEDAARIDGCGFLRIYWHVMLPLVKPSLAAIAIFTFMGTWNDFLGPLLYVADQRLYPLAFGLYAFSVQVSSNPVLTMAASLLMTVPVIVIFFMTQRYFVQGITLTGMKG